MVGKGNLMAETMDRECDMAKNSMYVLKAEEKFIFFKKVVNCESKKRSIIPAT